jgi:predicted nucleic acid-binding protein
VIIVDTGVLYAFFVADDPDHDRAATVLTDPGETIVISPLVVAELDYFVLKRFGIAGEMAALQEITGANYEIAYFDDDDLYRCLSVIERFEDHAIGVTDASLVVLADRYDTRRIATFDRRHFSALRSFDGQPFTLLP